MRAVRFTNLASLSLALLGISDTRPASQSTSPFRNFLATIKDRPYREISRLVSWARASK